MARPPRRARTLRLPCINGAPGRVVRAKPASMAAITRSRIGSAVTALPPAVLRRIHLGPAPRYVLCRMTFSDFKHTLDADNRRRSSSPALTALWHDGKGDWEGAHTVAQDITSPDGSWIHAYLHRKEGDPSNAGYWYRRAGKPVGTRHARRGVGRDRDRAAGLTALERAAQKETPTAGGRRTTRGRRCSAGS